MQVYSDVGLRGSCGAAGYAIFIINTTDPSTSRLAFIDTVFLTTQTSGFVMEVIAADRAIKAVHEIGKRFAIFWQ